MARYVFQAPTLEIGPFDSSTSEGRQVEPKGSPWPLWFGGLVVCGPIPQLNFGGLGGLESTFFCF